MPLENGGDQEAAPILIHASAVRLLGKGVLLLGRSASGKSDLALRLIDAGAVLIADDQVRLVRTGDRLLADAPGKLAGLIELRGIGILRVPHEPGLLDLAVDLDASGSAGSSDPNVDRLPDRTWMAWQGVELPRIGLDATAPSAVARIKMVLQAERVF